jgi:sulfatase maturation enzyme AslB (radical SAM superfamily)
MQIVKFYEKGYDPEQLIVQWNLGNTCNYKCEYCPSILHRGDLPWVELPLIEETLFKIQNFFPKRKIYLEFLGGEITLYKDFINLMIFCKENNFRNLIFSNASRTFRHWEAAAPVIDRALLTFHPHTAEKNHFEHVVNLLISKEKKIFVHIAMVKDMFLDTLKFAEHLHFKFPELYISLTPMMDKNHNRNFNGYFYSYSEQELNILKKFDHSSEKYIVDYNTGYQETVSLLEVRERNLNSFKNFKCGENRDIIVIDNRGYASTSICRQKPFINILDGRIEDLFNHDNICKLDTCNNPSDIRIYKSLE